MELSRYLLFTGRLTRMEYQELTLDQHLWGVPTLDNFPPEDLCSRHVDQIADLATLRELPFIEVLRTSAVGAEVCARSGKNLEALVDECNEWHRDSLEPICSYSTSSKFGRGIYEQQYEKKLVGQYLVAEKARDASTLIGNGDTVVLFEGSSGLYVGLAIAAVQEGMAIITPNTALIREHRDNPAVAQGFKLEIVGGTADVETPGGRCEHGGVYGETCVQQLVHAVSKEPPATILVVTVSGLLANAGPFDTGPIGSVKRDLIVRALKSKVKAVVFVTDYRKHIDTANKTFGASLFNNAEWKKYTSQYQEKMHIVTSPPPKIRAALVDGRLTGMEYGARNGAVTAEMGFGPEEVHYNQAAVQLHKLLGSDIVRGVCQPRFHEAFKAILGKAYYEKIRDASVISFSIAIPGVLVTEGGIRTWLRGILGSADIDVSKFDIRLSRDETGTTVRISATGNAGQRLKEFAEAGSREQRVTFMRVTGARSLRLDIGDQSTVVDLEQV